MRYCCWGMWTGLLISKVCLLKWRWPHFFFFFKRMNSVLFVLHGGQYLSLLAPGYAARIQLEQYKLYIYIYIYIYIIFYLNFNHINRGSSEVQSFETRSLVFTLFYFRVDILWYYTAFYRFKMVYSANIYIHTHIQYKYVYMHAQSISQLQNKTKQDKTSQFSFMLLILCE